MPHVDKHSNIKVKKHEGLQSSVINRKRARESDSDSPGENATSDEEPQSSEGAEGARVSQWVDDEENENHDDSDVPEPLLAHEQEGRRSYTVMMSDLASLSFGALLKARRALAKQAADDTSESNASTDEESSEDSEDNDEEHGDIAGLSAQQDKPERKPIEKRANKHA
ncbi:4104_t:CDS:2 [Acaulospora colombiana]|uniref:4104_t:CDS:1 n=1 Tax=Acaulospora colombiana TaxID=27376 RepID=A0ACA9L8L9_9GLOM|nr:4104_t:CDS:2 [Acaulospora colombiana]